MTISISALCPESGQLGIAISSSSIAVGARCPWLLPGVGAVASQNITLPALGPQILAGLEAGLPPEQALKQALGDKKGIRRFADATVPLDEALAKAVVDISGRPYCVCSGEPEGYEFCMIGGHFTGSLVRHVMESIAFHAGICLHMQVLAGRDPHHIAEAEFKALARALRFAVEIDPRVDGVPSTKGAL